MNTTWENLAKSALEPTLIEQAIAEQIGDHNNDSDAHLGAGQALESHRAAEIIDHLAESVVNDKIQRAARAYVAIVGSGVDGDFTTLQDAIEYSESVGGGTVLLRPGTYYLSGAVSITMRTNIVGVDRDSCVIVTDYASGDYLLLADDTVTNQKNILIENITLHTVSSIGIQTDDDDITGDYVIDFRNCNFTGGGTYFSGIAQLLRISYCNAQLGANFAFAATLNAEFYFCNFTRYGTSNNMLLSNAYLAPDNELEQELYFCKFDSGAATTPTYWTGATINYTQLFGCRFISWKMAALTIGIYRMMYCQINLIGTDVFELGTRDTGCIFIGNSINQGAAANFKVSGSNVVAVGNNYNGIVSNTGTGNLITNNQPLDDIEVLAAATTALALAGRRVTQLSPNSTRTLTTTVPQAGEERILIILTSGTTSYTMTFGTGFKAVGTLATGTTTARRFVIRFVSDGTYLIETGRTASIA